MLQNNTHKMYNKQLTEYLSDNLIDSKRQNGFVTPKQFLQEHSLGSPVLGREVVTSWSGM